MAHRQFTDAAGVVWRVFETDPTAFPADWEHRAAMLHADFLGGWLTFASDSDTRRLAPIPRAWRDMPDEELGFLCNCSKPDGADCEGITRGPSREAREAAKDASHDASHDAGGP